MRQAIGIAAKSHFKVERRARRWLSRDTDPLSIENHHLHQVCAHLNSTPRKCLGFKTPAEVFQQKVLAAKR